MCDAAAACPKPCGRAIRKRQVVGTLILLAIVRLLVIVAVLAIIGFGSMFALVHLVEPEPREYSVTVPPNLFNK